MCSARDFPLTIYPSNIVFRVSFHGLIQYNICTISSIFKSRQKPDIIYYIKDVGDDKSSKTYNDSERTVCYITIVRIFSQTVK